MSGAAEASPAGALVRVALKRPADKGDVEAPAAADAKIVAATPAPAAKLGYLGLFRCGGGRAAGRSRGRRAGARVHAGSTTVREQRLTPPCTAICIVKPSGTSVANHGTPAPQLPAAVGPPPPPGGPPPARAPPRPPRSYASRRDKLTALGGVLAAMVGGAMVPVFTIFLGNLFNALGDPGADLMAEVRRCARLLGSTAGLAGSSVQCCTDAGAALQACLPVCERAGACPDLVCTRPPPPPARSNVVKIVYLGLAACAAGYAEITLCTLAGARRRGCGAGWGAAPRRAGAVAGGALTQVGLARAA